MASTLRPGNMVLTPDGTPAVVTHVPPKPHPHQPWPVCVTVFHPERHPTYARHEHADLTKV